MLGIEKILKKPAIVLVIVHKGMYIRKEGSNNGGYLFFSNRWN